MKRNFMTAAVVVAAAAIGVGLMASAIFRAPAPYHGADAEVQARIAPVGQVNLGPEPLMLAAIAGKAGQEPAATPDMPTAAAPPPANETQPPAPPAPAEPLQAEVVTTPATSPTAPAGGTPVVARWSGRETYDKVCFVCHAEGIAGAPVYGDARAWKTRIAQGTAVLVEHAIQGFQGDTGVMPARGGIPTLSDEEIAAAVMYLVEAVDAGSAPAVATPAPVAAPAPAAPAPPVSTAPTPSQPATPISASDPARGKEVYDTACFVCHGTGAAGAPRFGDKTAWAARIAQGAAILYDRAVNGFMGETGLMPPRGGRPDFSVEDIKAAVDYLIAGSR